MCFAQDKLPHSEQVTRRPGTQGTPPNVAGVFPLSFMQESLWAIEQMGPSTPAYNLVEAWRLKGKLDVETLRRCLREILRRHESLRTVIRSREGCPVQVIYRPWDLALPLIPLSTGSDPEAAVSAFLHQKASRPFDLGTGPLWRVCLLAVSPDEHVLVSNIHHLISDAWSQHLFIRELSQLYPAFASGNPSPLPELPIQYADYAVWQRDTMRSRSPQHELEFWTRQLREAPVLPLPADYPRPQSPTWRGRTDFLTLSPGLSEELKRLSRARGVTLFVTLLAAFKGWLHRCTNEQDIVVGSPFSARDRVEIEDLIGYFVNTLPLRTRVSGDTTFAELLGRVREVVLQAANNQSVPLTDLMTALKPQRQAGTHPLFQAVLGLQNASPDEWTWPGVTATRIELDSGTSKFDWTLLVTDVGNGLRVRSESSSDLFSAETARLFLQSFEAFLESVVKSPDAKISELPLMRAAEQVRVLEEWNRTATDYGRELGVPEVFESQVRSRPNAVALEFEGRTLSYRELNLMANRVARNLTGVGVRPGMVVGLGIRRSFEMIIGMVGILKAGAAYVPLDADYPAERVRFILEDSGAAAVLVDRHFPIGALEPAGGLETGDKRNGRGCRAVLITGALEDASGGSDKEWETTDVSGDDLAYVMYTSGTTGTPKGVAIPQRGVLRLVRNTNYVRIGTDDVFLQLSSASFDASTFEIWGPLLNGARLVIFPPEMPSLRSAAECISQQGVTILWLTAGFFNQMVDHELSSLRGVRQLLTGGEALSVPHVTKALKHLKHCDIINGYGPTENTTFTCCYRIPRDWRPGRSVPIGTPISNSSVFVLDREMKPVPVGVPGELCAAGDGLARGYLNEAVLTEEKFVPAPSELGFGAGRLYRTGDLVRWLPEGNLEFLGRIDEQVKIRGFRVEPSEIEAALKRHPSVLRSAVVAARDETATNRLVAYFVPRPEMPVGPGALREFLNCKLPPFMVPSQFIELDELPLTSNGKVDRKGLPCPNAEPQRALDQGLAPRTKTERALRQMWEEVLGRNSFGVEDNFFELGGHSLTAIQVISRISRSFKVDLPVRVLFENPTIAGLALAVEKGDAAGNGRHSSGDCIPEAQRARMRDILEHLNDLSEAEVEALLRDPDLNDCPR